MTQEKDRKQNQQLGKKGTDGGNKIPTGEPDAPPAVPHLFGMSASAESSMAPPTPAPDPAVRKNPRLDLWSVLMDEGEPFQDEIRYRLQGEVHGHPNPKFSDGEFITTSTLISLDVAAKKARTKHTTYDIGDPDPTFVEYVESIKKKIEDYTFSTEENLRKHPRRPV